MFNLMANFENILTISEYFEVDVPSRTSFPIMLTQWNAS